MYLGSWKLDDLLTFPASTHRFDTGNGADADSVPTYRVYEDETGTPILTGSMAKLDDAGTVGFYSEQITLSAANGFEKGKAYTIYITATVNSVTGTTHHTFQLEAEVNVTAIKNKTDNLPSDPADASDIAASFASITSTLATIAAYIDTEIAAMKVVTDKLNTAMELDGAVYRFTENALEEAPSGGGGGGGGPDAVEHTYTVTNSISGAPIDGVEVWVSTDSGQTNIVWYGHTNTFGIAVDNNGNKPLLDVGNYYFWCRKSNYIFNNPDLETVS